MSSHIRETRPRGAFFYNMLAETYRLNDQVSPVGVGGRCSQNTQGDTGGVDSSQVSFPNKTSRDISSGTEDVSHASPIASNAPANFPVESTKGDSVRFSTLIGRSEPRCPLDVMACFPSEPRNLTFTKSVTRDLNSPNLISSIWIV